MRDLAILVAAGWTLVGLHFWAHWYLPVVILAAVSLVDHDEPETVTGFDLTVADTRWGTATWPACRWDLVL